MTNREKQKLNLPFKMTLFSILEQIRAKLLVKSYNRMIPYNVLKANIIFKLLKIKHKRNVYFAPPFFCDYGKNIEIGSNFYSNMGCTILDTAKVQIGDDVLFGPNVSLFTASHPIHRDMRKLEYQYGIPIRIENGVWIGGNTVILPGVTIGQGSVIGAGSVVTKDIPESVVAVGNPCKVIRKISNVDKKYYFKKMEWDNII